MYILAIDFGHGETSVAVLSLDTEGTVLSPEVYEINKNAKVVSLIYKQEMDDKWMLSTQINVENLGQSQYVKAYFKYEPDVEYETGRGNAVFNKDYEDNKYHYGIFIKNIVSAIKKNHPGLWSYDGTPDFKLYIAAPSGWSDKQYDLYKDFVEQNAGLSVEKVLKESDAAYAYATSNDPNVKNNMASSRAKLIIDIGSSTIDLTYFDGSDYYTDSRKLGASRVETDIFYYMKENERLAKEAWEKILEKDITEAMAKEIVLLGLRDAKERFYLDYSDSKPFLPEIKCASVTGCADFSRYDSFTTDSVQGYTAATLHTEILKKYINEIRIMLQAFKAEHKIENVSVMLTGGAARMPFISEIIEEVFDSELVETGDKSFCVVKGIAVYGFRDYKQIPQFELKSSPNPSPTPKPESLDAICLPQNLTPNYDWKRIYSLKFKSLTDSYLLQKNLKDLELCVDEQNDFLNKNLFDAVSMNDRYLNDWGCFKTGLQQEGCVLENTSFMCLLRLIIRFVDTELAGQRDDRESLSGKLRIVKTFVNICFEFINGRDRFVGVTTSTMFKKRQDYEREVIVFRMHQVERVIVEMLTLYKN